MPSDMQFTCSRDALTAALSAVSGVVPSRTTKEILKNVKLQVTSAAATLIGTDSEIGMRCVVPDVTCDSGGEALLPTARVLSILRELGDDTVKLEITGDALWIRGGYSEFRLSAEPASDFPPVPDFKDATYFALPASSLRQLIRRTVFATDVESTRYALGGVLMELNPERATLAATDSRRLSVATASCRVEGSPTPPSSPPVVPAKAMSLLEKVLTDGDTEARIAIHTNDVVIQAGGVTVSAQLVQGRFPDYRKVIPGQFSSTVEMVVGPFYSAVRQAQIVTNEESRGVDFTFAKGVLRLSSQAADVGQSKIELPISYDGADLTITFDPRYIADFLRTLDGGTPIRFQLIDHESAAVLATDDQYTYVIMPLSRDR
jgi:DNA polymerase-3 subunit beta